MLDLCLYILFILEENLFIFSTTTNSVNRSMKHSPGRYLFFKKGCTDERPLIDCSLRVAWCSFDRHQSGPLVPDPDEGRLTSRCRAKVVCLLLLLLHRHQGSSVLLSDLFDSSPEGGGRKWEYATEGEERRAWRGGRGQGMQTWTFVNI